MTFVAGFYSLNVELNNTDEGIFHKFRVKTARHPEESSIHLQARLLAFVHSYREGLRFTQGLFEPKEPTFIQQDATEEILLWGQVGVPERKKLETALRRSPKAAFRDYFYLESDLPTFCHMLRGSKINWVSPIQFYSIDPKFLEKLSELERSSVSWSVTCIDDHIYLNCDGHELDTQLTSLDIWSAFQNSIGNEKVA